MDEHIIEALGKTRIKIQNGKICEIGEPEIEYCPLFHKHKGIEKLTKEAVQENIEFRIEDFGMCTPQRQIKMKDFLNFGISEILSTLLKENLIDCVIMVCEGCGTVIIDNPETAQGVGGRVSGLVKTTPIPEIIENIGTDKVLDPENARINQIQGIEKAIKMGYKNIAVTIAGYLDTTRIEKEYPEINIYKFAVHTSKLEKEEAEKIVETCDVITACASKNIREICEKQAIYKVGEEIPIYAMTNTGELFLKLRLEKIGGPKPPKENPKYPDPLI